MIPHNRKELYLKEGSPKIFYVPERGVRKIRFQGVESRKRDISLNVTSSEAGEGKGARKIRFQGMVQGRSRDMKDK